MFCFQHLYCIIHLRHIIGLNIYAVSMSPSRLNILLTYYDTNWKAILQYDSIHFNSNWLYIFPWIAAELAAKKSRVKQSLIKRARSVAIFSLKLKERRAREAEKQAYNLAEQEKVSEIQNKTKTLSWKKKLFFRLWIHNHPAVN